MFRSTVAGVLAAGLSVLYASTALAAPAFVNGITIDANTTDLSGDTTGVTPTLNQRLGMFSDIYYDPNRNEWYGLSDRGPGGGTLTYDTRVQKFTIDINPVTGAISNFQVVQTVKFTDPNNVLGAGAGTLNGKAPLPGSTDILGRSFDPEGIVVNPLTGTLLVSDEYGPSVYEFNRNGELLRAFKTPDNLIPRNAGTSTPNYAGDAGNNAGKRTNRGFEGLAISPDGKYAYAMLQSAMLDEGAGSGVYNRIVKFDTTTGEAVAQYAYRMEVSSQGRGISALVALNDDEFLVLERNNRGIGVDSELTPVNKKVFKISLSGATDVTGIDLDSGASFTAVAKDPALYLDLAAAGLAELGNRSPEKWEGLAIGPQLLNGDYLILAGTDNDYSITQNADGVQFDRYYNPATNTRIQCDIGTFINCFKVDSDGGLGDPFADGTDGYELIPGVLYAYRDSLANYVAPVPEPETLAILGLGLGGLYIARRRRKA